MVIDAHHHLKAGPGYPEKLAAECRRLGIDRVCVFSAGTMSAIYGIAENAAVLKAMEKYPEVIIGFACFNLGIDPLSKADEIARQGFKGVKFITPTRNYDDRSFYPVYGRLEALGLPVLFHLGIVSRNPGDRYYDIDNSRHRPIYLDTIARAFPDLKIIGAHLGNPWYEEAAMAARWNPNLYFDLSGSTLKCKSSRFLGDLLWWTPESRYRDPSGRHAWEKIVFGSDVDAEEIEDVMKDYRKVMDELNLSPEIQRKVFGGTMAEILGIKESGNRISKM